MQIKMLTTSAGPDGVRNAGEIHDVDDEKAAELIAGGFAEAVDAAPVAQAASAEPEDETATLDEATETADARPRRGRK